MRRPVSTLIALSAVRRLNEFRIGLAWSICGEAPHHLISGRLASEPAPTSRMLGEVARSRRTGPIFLADQSPGGCRSTSFPVRRRQPVEDGSVEARLRFQFSTIRNQPVTEIAP